MTDPLQLLERAAAPYTLWLKLAAWGLGIAACIGIGWAAHDAFDGTKAAKAETQVAQTVARCETARADANGAAAVTTGRDTRAAAGADRATAAQETPRKRGYDAAEQEASHVPLTAAPAACIDPEPLRQLFIGLRDADAAAATGADRGGASAAALDPVPGPGGNR